MIAQRLKKMPHPYELVVVGMGVDGHIASLFPHQPWEQDGSSCVPAVAPSSPQQRLSLAPAELLNSRQIVLIIAGSAKQAVLERAIKEKGSDSEMPVRMLLAPTAPPLTIFAADQN